MSKKMNLKNIIVFVAGAGIGGAVTYFAMKKYTEARITEEIVEFKESYKDSVLKQAFKAADPSEQASEKNEEDTSEYDEIIRKLNYNEYSKKDSQNEDAEPDEIDRNLPYIISDEEYLEMEEYDKVTLFFFDEDYIFINDDDEIIGNAEDLLGKENLVGISDALYIRNEKFGIDYEVILQNESYESYAARTYANR